MRCKTWNIWLVLFCVLMIQTASARETVEPPSGAVLPVTSLYSGRIVDESGKPVGGIYPMVFKIYPSLSARKPIWSESWWVAVDGGTYRVQLGSKKPLPVKANLTKMVLAVEISGVGEVVREPFRGNIMGGGEGPAAIGAQSHAKSGVKYADAAGYAVTAEHAKNSDRLQNLTVEELTRKIAEEVGSRSGVRVGKSRRLGNRIGGPGGNVEYNEICPPGTVMVGIKGGAGIYIDSIQIVCAPLE